MVKRYILPVLLMLISFGASAQLLKPVEWEFTSQKVDDNYILIFKANIDEGWHMYGLHQDLEGQKANEILFNDSIGTYELVGPTEETGRSKEGYDEMFGIDVKKYYSKAIFRQKVKLKGEGTTVRGLFTYITCTNKECIFEEEEFSFDIGDLSKSSVPAETPPTLEQSDDDGYVEEAETENLSVWGIFIGGFIGGLLALLTPCVFPMIPLTVSFFTKQSANKAKGIFNGSLYGIFIVLIYVGPMFLITKIMGGDALNAMASNAFFNLLFFIIFLIFAISFFGAFEITLPSSLVNKADSFSDKGGIIGIFFMAFTLALVSFSCTGPIIGTLLVEAAVRGGNLGPMVGLLGFSLALALPFGLFAAFPGWMNSLPKSGGWLNAVKVSLGFLELALALKFLSNVDLAYHWGFLKREIFLALWVVIFTLWGFYLLGKLKFAHDSDLQYISIPRLFIAVISFSFAFYMVPGMWGAPLKLLSGLQPPMFYTIWEGASPANAVGGGSSGGGDHEAIAAGGGGHCPHNLNCFHDYDQGMEYARKSGKPVMVDFTGWTCVNCRKMEENVWIDPRVMKMLRDDYVLISLYVDDKEELPKSEQGVSETTGKKIRTVGNKWSDMQIVKYNRNSQPWYVLLDHNEEELIKARGYTPDADMYTKFLEKGLEAFSQRKSTAITLSE